MRIIQKGMRRGDRLAVGRVVRAHGIAGEIKIQPYSGQPGDFRGYARLRFSAAGREEETGRDYEILGSRGQGSLAILRLAGLQGRDEAEALQGREASVAVTDLPALQDGACYWHEIEGKAVVSDDGRVLGVVGSLLRTAAHDILVVTGPDGEYLIPAVPGFVAGFVEGGRALLVTPPPGLLEMNR